MRLNTKNQRWAYSIGRLWSQIRAGSLSDSAARSLLYPITNSLAFSNHGSSRYQICGCWLLAHLRKLKCLVKSGLVGWLVLIAQFSLPVYGEQTDDAAIHLQLDRLHEMASQANFDAYFALYAPDAVFIGTDAGERWTIGEFKAYAEPHFSAGRGWTYQTIERHIMGEGAVRWFDELLWNEKLGPCRGSGVMVKVGAEWLVSHYVLSLAVPNQIAGEVGARAISIEKARRPESPSYR